MIRIQGIPAVSAALLRAQKVDTDTVERNIEVSNGKSTGTAYTQDSRLRSDVQVKATAA
jgi:hypothetical protein